MLRLKNTNVAISYLIQLSRNIREIDFDKYIDYMVDSTMVDLNDWAKKNCWKRKI